MNQPDRRLRARKGRIVADSAGYLHRTVGFIESPIEIVGAIRAKPHAGERLSLGSLIANRLGEHHRLLRLAMRFGKSLSCRYRAALA